MAYSVALGLHGKVKNVDPRGYGRCTGRNSRSYVDVPPLVDIQVGVIEGRLLLSAFHLHSGVAFALGGLPQAYTIQRECQTCEYLGCMAEEERDT